MTITINLPAETEKKLLQAAAQDGIAPDAYVRKLIETSLNKGLSAGPSSPPEYFNEIQGWVRKRFDESAMSSSNSDHLFAILRQLVELRNEEDSDEYGMLRAPEDAFDRARNMLADAAVVAARHRRQIPHGCASTDSEGSIRIEWVRPTRSVHLVVPTAVGRDAYIYHEVGDEYATDPATPEGLARWLGVIEA